MKKKVISLFLCSLIAGGSVSLFSVNAAENEQEAHYIRAVENNNLLTYYNENGEEVDVDKLNNDIDVNESSLPSKYDLRNYNRLTSVKNQGSEGLCWDFAATASMESNILTNPELSSKAGDTPYKTLDLSERGNTWYIHTNFDDESSPLYGDYMNDPSKGSGGGSADLVAQGLCAGFGAYPESLLPYEQLYSGCPEGLRYYSDYRLKDYSELSKDNALIKKSVMEKGAVAISYNCFAANTYMVDGMQSYYDNGNPIDGVIGQAHLVVVAGWDDSYSRENFNPEMQPQSDGAWLCKNSWGEENCSTADGYKGYFWMSYETPLNCVASFEMQSVDEFDNIYQHQITALAGFDVESAANVFTAKSDEVLKQVCLQTIGATDVKIEIYKLNSGFTSPQDGELLSSFDASFDFTGIHTVECPENIKLSAGDNFSVVVTGKSDMLLNFKVNSEDEISGRSYCIKDGGSWTDVADKWECGYAVIKAYTSNDGEVRKTELEELVKTGEELTPDKDVSADILEELNARLNSAKEILNDKNATQNSIDNEYCLLKCSVDKVGNFTFTVNSVDDYCQLIKRIEDDGDSNINKIVLGSDLDFGGKEIRTIFNKNQFSGIFDGNGHKMSNFVIDSMEKYNSGLFGGLYKATVKNIVFENCSVIAEDCATLISNYCTDSVIENCDVNNCKINAKSGAIIGAYLSGCKLTDCDITNAKVYGVNSAGLYFINGFETTTENCTSKGTELYSENMLYDENLTVSLLTTGEGGVPRIKLADGKCTVESFIGMIKSLEANGKQLAKEGNAYVVDETSGDIYLTLVCDMSESGNYGVTGDLETGELFLLSYSGDSPDMVIPGEMFGKTISGFSESFSSNITYSDKITSVTIPGQIKSISSGAFTGMPALKKVVVEEGVEKLEGGAFSECPELTDVKLPDSLESIGGYAFGNCTKLKNIDFGNSLVEIGERAFYKCMNLCDIILPDSVKKICNRAFSHCSLKSVTLGRNIEEIEENAFAFTEMYELDSRAIMVPDFVINGYKDTAAKSYADKYGLKFVDLETQERVATGELFDYGMFMKGDVNLDGTISILDVTLVEKWIVGDTELSPVQLCNAIVGGIFGTIDVRNATEIQKYLAGLRDTLEDTAAG